MGGGDRKKILAEIIGKSQRVDQLQRGEGNFLDDGNVLYHDGDGGTTLCICYNSLNCI